MVTLVSIDNLGVRTQIFESESDNAGRFTHEFDAIIGGDYEMVVASGAYFNKQNTPKNDAQILSEIVIRFSVPDPFAQYHIPLIMSPNSYSCWWSSWS